MARPGCCEGLPPSAPRSWLSVWGVHASPDPRFLQATPGPPSRRRGPLHATRPRWTPKVPSARRHFLWFLRPPRAGPRTPRVTSGGPARWVPRPGPGAAATRQGPRAPRKPPRPHGLWCHPGLDGDKLFVKDDRASSRRSWGGGCIWAGGSWALSPYARVPGPLCRARSRSPPAHGGRSPLGTSGYRTQQAEWARPHVSVSPSLWKLPSSPGLPPPLPPGIAAEGRGWPRVHPAP